MKYQNDKIGYCFLVSNETRDYFLLLPIIYYLEKYEGFKISFEFIWDAHKIRKNPPDLVILPNVRGQLLYYEVAKYCHENAIPVYHNDSEGNFNTEIDYDFWAYNASKKYYANYLFTWNRLVKKFLLDKYPLKEEEVKITGAVGFDKYQYLPKANREKLLKKYNKAHFKKVVGYAGWAFGKLFNPEINDVLSNINKPGEAGKIWLAEQRDQVEACLKSVIEKYPDILFILKKHPRENFESDFRDSRNEMNQLLHFPNVLYLKDEEEIQDLIGISDLWMAFESTSIMEAWLMQVPTLMINPDPNFHRVNLYKGSMLVHHKEALLNIFQEIFEANDSSKLFANEILTKRTEIIQDAIGYADGFNHLRCLFFLREGLQSTFNSKKKPKLNWRFLRLYGLLHFGKYFYHYSLFKSIPKLKKTVWVFENYQLSEINHKKKLHYPYLDQFYQSKDLDQQIKSQEIWGKIEW